MNKSQARRIPIEQLAVGHVVHLEMGWMDHPFPLNVFRISSQQQLVTLRSLGRGEFLVENPDDPLVVMVATTTPGDADPPAPDEVAPVDAAALRREMLKAQRDSLLACEMTSPARTAMMVITTSSSMSVKPGRVEKLERGLSFMIFGWVCVGRVPGTRGVRKKQSSFR